MFNLGFGEIVLILIVALVVFGPKKLPELGKALGAGIREFKKATTDFQNSLAEPEQQPQQQQQPEGSQTKA